MLNTLFTVFLFTNYLHFGVNGFLVLGDDKRQDQIPIPRIGRALSEIPLWPYYLPLSTTLAPSGDVDSHEDILLLHDGRNNWILPHLGRRKRSLASGPKYEGVQKFRPYASSSAAFSSNMLAIEDLLRRSPWTILALKGIDKKMAFSPRLGRAMTPRLGKKSSSDMLQMLDKRAMTFSPRLGRSSTQQTIASDDLFNVDTRASAFSPRLGRAGRNYYTRASAFAPRLGRSDQDMAGRDNQTDHLNA